MDPKIVKELFHSRLRHTNVRALQLMLRDVVIPLNRDESPYIVMALRASEGWVYTQAEDGTEYTYDLHSSVSIISRDCYSH